MSNYPENADTNQQSQFGNSNNAAGSMEGYNANSQVYTSSSTQRVVLWDWRTKVNHNIDYFPYAHYTSPSEHWQVKGEILNFPVQLPRFFLNPDQIFKCYIRTTFSFNLGDFVDSYPLVGWNNSDYAGVKFWAQKYSYYTNDGVSNYYVDDLGISLPSGSKVGKDGSFVSVDPTIKNNVTYGSYEISNLNPLMYKDNTGTPTATSMKKLLMYNGTFSMLLDLYFDYLNLYGLPSNSLQTSFYLDVTNTIEIVKT
jgi:hypothetical protein